MKTKANIFVILLFMVCIKSKAQWFGQQLYAVDSCITSSARQTSHYPGYIIGAYREIRQNGGSNPDFVIYKVDPKGQFNNPTDFAIEFQITPCAGTPRRCSGVTVVESSSPVQSQYYALAASSTLGIAFATLDQNGNIIKSLFLDFPAIQASTTMRRPALRESSVPGKYYVAGVFRQDSAYIMKINTTTNPISVTWENWYGGGTGADLEPLDIIESPYNANEVVVVGGAFANFQSPLSPWAEDAFYMNLDASTGAVNTFSLYNKQFDGDEHFTCIEIAASTNGGSDGYVLGGRCKYPNVAHNKLNDSTGHWMAKITPAGNMVWNSLIQPRPYRYGGLKPGAEISRVAERYNINANTYEYYGVCEIDSIPYDLTVFKLDDNGSNTLSPNEFHYINSYTNKNIKQQGTAQLTHIETGGGADDGIQVFGTDSTLKNILFVKSYFNGISGCNEFTTTVRGVYQIVDTIRTIGVTVNQINSTCTALNAVFNTNVLSIAPTTICAAASIGNGSNAKTISSLGDKFAEGNHIQIFPNPNSGVLNISNTQGSKLNQIVLFDHLGNILKQFELAQNESSGMKVDLNPLEISAGIYFLKIYSDNKFYYFKVIYRK